MQHFWVVGTDTDIGKTLVTILFMRTLQKRGFRVTPYKPVQTGEVYDSEQSYYYDTAMYEKYSIQLLDRASLNCYSFKEAASPHFAARLEGRHISSQQILEQMQYLQQTWDIVICEGAGGLFVPLDSYGEMTLLDVIIQSTLPVVVVTRTSLGTINHTLLTLEALRTRNVEVLGIVFNGDTGSRMEQDNIKTILQYYTLPFAIIPKLKDISQINEDMIADTSLFERLSQYETSVI